MGGRRGAGSLLTSRIFEIVAAEFAAFTIIGLKYGALFARLKPLSPLLVFTMLLQPMYAIEAGWGLLRRLRRSARLLAAALLLYTALYPLETLLLVAPARHLLAPQAAALLAGVVLVALAPVAMPAPAFAALAGGNVELSIATVVATFAAAPLVMPIWARLLLHQAAAHSPTAMIVRSIVIYIGGSFAAAQALRLLVTRLPPSQRASTGPRVARLLALTSCLSLYTLVAIVVAVSAPTIARLAGSVAALAALLLAYNACRYLAAYLAARLLRAGCGSTVSLALTGSQNGALGMALAIPLGPLPAAGAVLAGPLIVLPTMAAVVRALRCPASQ